jgi:hypothetical protein
MRGSLPNTALLSCLLLITSCKHEKPSVEERAEQPAPATRTTWEIQENQASANTSYVEDQDFSLAADAWSPCENTQALAPNQGYIRVTVPVEVKSRSRSSVPIGPLFFHLEDSDGHRFPSTLAGCKRPLPGREVKDAQIAKGDIAFDVPENRMEFDLVFTPFLIGRKESPARVRIPIPR